MKVRSLLLGALLAVALVVPAVAEGDGPFTIGDGGASTEFHMDFSHAKNAQGRSSFQYDAHRPHKRRGSRSPRTRTQKSGTRRSNTGGDVTVKPKPADERIDELTKTIKSLKAQVAELEKEKSGDTADTGSTTTDTGNDGSVDTDADNDGTKDAPTDTTPPTGSAAAGGNKTPTTNTAAATAAQNKTSTVAADQAVNDTALEAPTGWRGAIRYWFDLIAPWFAGIMICVALLSGVLAFFGKCPWVVSVVSGVLMIATIVLYRVLPALGI